ncbi:hypothetical protein J2T17_001980 [Paenibacillus mucilaginosus]|uniref:M23 family metallopeptidase n=1 Tax=Paenibacillus mucilaginosus TaxID=61624 RepID=UPI003D1D279B
MRKQWICAAAGTALLLLAVLPAGHALGSVPSSESASVSAGSRLSSPAGLGKRLIRPKKLPDAFIQGDYARIYAQLSPELQVSFSAAELEQAGTEFFRDTGSLHLLTKVDLSVGTQYIWANADAAKGLMAVFSSDGSITGLLLKPLTPYPESDARLTHTAYRMPVTGSWFVFWGGTNELLNYHYPYESQRYAYDLVVARRDGTTYTGDPAKLESYFAFGREVVAPSDGRVIRTLDSVPDNSPVGGTTNRAQPFGNYVVIDHGGGEYSVLAHLQLGSVKVQPGQAVKRGEAIGRCGNSGNSTEPHIHYQVQNSPEPGEGQSLRIRPLHGEEPIRGEFVRGMGRQG